MLLDLRPLTLGELLDRSFSLYRHHFWLFVGIMALPSLLGLSFGLLVALFSPQPVSPESVEQVNPAEILGAVLWFGAVATGMLAVYFVTYAVALGATTVAVSQLYTGRSTSIREAYAPLKGRVGRLAWLLLLVSARLIGIVLFIVVLIGFAGGLAAVGFPVIAGIAIFVAAIASAFLWVWLLLRYAVCVPAVGTRRCDGDCRPPAQRAAHTRQPSSRVRADGVRDDHYLRCARLVPGPISCRRRHGRSRVVYVLLDEPSWNHHRLGRRRLHGAVDDCCLRRAVRRSARSPRRARPAVDAGRARGASGTRSGVELVAIATPRATHHGASLGNPRVRVDGEPARQPVAAASVTNQSPTQLADDLDALAREVSAVSIADAPALAARIPDAWMVVASNQNRTPVATKWLTSALVGAASKPDAWPVTRAALGRRLEQVAYEVRSAGDGNLASARARARSSVDAVLSRTEFQQSAASRWREQLQERVGKWFEQLLGRFGAGAGAGRRAAVVLAWAAALAALVGLGFWLARTLAAQPGAAALGLDAGGAIRPRAREMALRALASLANGHTRDAIRQAYGAALVRFEEQGVWRIDEARTPREYLPILPAHHHRRAAFVNLTRRFEQIWYGNRVPADDDARSVSEHLEILGCLRPGEQRSDRARGRRRRDGAADGRGILPRAAG